MADPHSLSDRPEPRRYLALLQDERGYGKPLEPAPPEGPSQPVLFAVVKADDHEAEVERLRAENEALKAERERAVETRENANTVSVRVEAENARLTRLLNDRDNALFMVAQHLHRATEEITKYEASIALATDEEDNNGR